MKDDKFIKIKIINTSINKEFFINLKPKEKNIKEELNNLVPYVISLNKKIKNLEKEIENNKKDFENKIKQIEENHKREISLLRNEINEIKNQKITNINNNVNTFFKGSNIIKSNEVDLILSWLDKKPKNSTLLLDSNIDGDSWNAFFNKVGNKYPTILFIKTKQNYRFGRYTRAIWPKDGPARDATSFIFSLDKKEKYKVSDPDNAIGCRENSWISFGYGSDLYFYDKCTTTTGGIGKHYYHLPSNCEINGGNGTRGRRR